jgi:serine protease Do
MTPTKAQGVGLNKPIGVFISAVLPDKAADKAGIVAGDVILEVEGVEVNKPNQLQAKVGSYNPGDEISLLIWRDGRKKTFDIVLEGRDDQITTVQSERRESEKKVRSLGINVRNMTNDELSMFDLDYGILIHSVESNTPASREGLRGGEVIYKVDGERIKTVSEFREYIEDREKGSIVKVQTRSRYSNRSTSDRLVFLKIPK